MNDKPRRRWYQYSLRTMFVFTLVVSIPMAWVGYSLNWIRQRHRVLVDIAIEECDGPGPAAPGGLWLFGEKGMQRFWLRPESRIIVEEAVQLFPEAEIGTATLSPTGSWLASQTTVLSTHSTNPKMAATGPTHPRT